MKNVVLLLAVVSLLGCGARPLSEAAPAAPALETWSAAITAPCAPLTVVAARFCPNSTNAIHCFGPDGDPVVGCSMLHLEPDSGQPWKRDECVPCP